MKNYLLPTTYHLLRRAVLTVLTLAHCLGVFISCPASFGADGSIIVDHTAVQEFDQIPDEYIEKAKELIFHFGVPGRGEVGLEIIVGLARLEIDDPKYKIYLKIDGEEVSSEESSALHINMETHIYHEDYWSTDVGRSNTRTFASSGEYDCSMWLWDDEDYTDYGEVFIQDYLQQLDEFEQDYPDMRFIYATRYLLDGEEITNHNDIIRTYCRNNNKVLFDLEDIMLHFPFDPDSEELEIYLIKARAFWWMMARLAGWDGITSGEYILGDVSGNGVVRIHDAYLTARYAVGLENFTPEQIRAAEVDGKGRVTMNDAWLIAEYAIGLRTKFPVED